MDNPKRNRRHTGMGSCWKENPGLVAGCATRPCRSRPVSGIAAISNQHQRISSPDSIFFLLPSWTTLIVRLDCASCSCSAPSPSIEDGGCSQFPPVRPRPAPVSHSRSRLAPNHPRPSIQRHSQAQHVPRVPGMRSLGFQAASTSHVSGGRWHRLLA